MSDAVSYINLVGSVTCGQRTGAGRVRGRLLSKETRPTKHFADPHRPSLADKPWEMDATRLAACVASASVRRYALRGRSKYIASCKEHRNGTETNKQTNKRLTARGVELGKEPDIVPLPLTVKNVMLHQHFNWF